jgi:hypothetical protein
MMESIKFYAVPKWAKWIALDTDGDWYAYRSKPERSEPAGELPKECYWIHYEGERERERVYPVISSTLQKVANGGCKL